jgi:hypothetical protein
MDYRKDHISGNPITVMSEVWECFYPYCNYTTNVVEDRRDHRAAHKAGTINEVGAKSKAPKEVGFDAVRISNAHRSIGK